MKTLIPPPIPPRPRTANCPPPIYMATAYDGTKLGPFPIRGQAIAALQELLEEYHEGIAFESDYQHEHLDRLFWTGHKIEEI